MSVPVATHHLLPPTSSLPRLRGVEAENLTEEQILAALRGLTELYCPFPNRQAFQSSASKSLSQNPGVATPSQLFIVDSGYASEDEDENERQEHNCHGEQRTDTATAEQLEIAMTALEALEELRADSFERAFAEHWLTNLIARSETIPCLDCETTREHAIEQASKILAAFAVPSDIGYGQDDRASVDTFEDGSDDDDLITRDFSFDLLLPPSNNSETGESTTASATMPIHVQLKDGLAGTSGSDHTDVGLQSWGASIIFSQLLCANSTRFGLTLEMLRGPSSSQRRPRIVELGAGTGLVSIVLGKMLPQLGFPNATVLATDYHTTVLSNLRSNIAANFASDASSPQITVEARALDWATAPDGDEDPADIIVATDVVYAAEHARLLRDVAKRLLKRPGGTFWMVATVRLCGKFEGISDTVRGAFGDGGEEDTLRILSEEWLDKRDGVGRGDESGYRMFRIGWVEG